LDPSASGLLVVALGRATRLLPYAPLEPKCYSFCIRFGEQTDTLDSAGTVIKTGGNAPSAPALLAALPSFCGRLMQVPPEYSAVKVNGIRAYHVARSGRVPTMRPRPIAIHALHLVKYNELSGEAQLEVACSGGTYVRSLARDIAKALGTCGYALFVRRTALGPFHVDRAAKIDKCSIAKTPLVPSGKVLQRMSRIEVGEEQKQRIIAGCNLLFTEVPGVGALPVATTLAVDHDDNIVAVLEPNAAGYFHPAKVFSTGLRDSMHMRS
jgi:tRNA pseudouridine55 synthase